jgi:serine/threonine-protein kinase
MATVWRAIQRGPGRFRRTVAIKQLHDHLAVDATYREMFVEEARVGALLDDPNLARVQDFFEDQGQLFLVMEWVEGIDLATYLRYVAMIGERARWELVTAVGIGMLRGLAAAHEHADEEGRPCEILHRDVSPHNVLISTKGPARLIDFGLAKATDRLTAPTPPGTAKGKLAYLSPEIARGEPATAKSDQFAAASVLWEALAGKKLFDGADQGEVFRRLATADIAPLDRQRDDLPRKLVKLIERALDADPEDRHPSARALAVALGEVLKSAQSRVDLYQLLATTVIEARAALDMGRRTQAPVLAEAIQLEESQPAILLPLMSAWRRLRSVIPFLGESTPPRPQRRALPAPTEPTPSEPRVSPDGVLRLSPGEEARVGELLIRCIAPDLDRTPTPTDPVARVEVGGAKVALHVPSQAVVAGRLVSALARENGRLTLRVDPIATGRSLAVFPHVLVDTGDLAVTVTGVDAHRVFLRLLRPGAPPEHTIVAMPGRGQAVVERPGHRIAIERVAPPWVVMRIDRR